MSVPWPPCQQAHEAYGIAVDICEVAGELWRNGCEQLALSEVGDAALGFDLMVETALNVTRYREEHPEQEIKSLRAYLLTSYKHILSAERKKRTRFDAVEEDRTRNAPGERQSPGAVPAERPPQVDQASLQEMLQKMAQFDEKLYRVFRYRAAGYTYKEIAPHYRMKENHLRSWFSKAMEEFKEYLKRAAGETETAPPEGGGPGRPPGSRKT